MKEITVSGFGIHTRKELHASLAAAMDFPEWYGHNLDALHDMLTEIGEDTCLIITDCAALEASLDTYYRSLGKVLKASARDNLHFTFRLVE